MILEVKNVTKYFGGLAALKNVSLKVNEGELIGLIGPNGAGKTTLFKVIAGIYRPSSGTVMFKGSDITGLRPYEICRLGIALTHQNPHPFLNMTVFDNVAIGAMFGKDDNLSLKDVKEEVIFCLDFVGLLGKKDVLAKNLTLAERKNLEIARALATKPHVILLDEVIAGLNPAESVKATEIIKRIRSELKITILWIEHVMRAIMRVAERIIVLHHGEVIAEGTPQEVATNKKVISAYLGEAKANST
jgi:branched-chain amino acid transport system ATP-binding protein